MSPKIENLIDLWTLKKRNSTQKRSVAHIDQSIHDLVERYKYAMHRTMNLPLESYRELEKELDDEIVEVEGMLEAVILTGLELV